MSFQIPTTTAAASTGGFSFGLSTSSAGAKPPTFSFGTTQQIANAPAKPLTFGAPAATVAPTFAAPAAAVAPTFAAPAAAVAPTSTPVANFGGFGTATPAATTAAPAFGAATITPAFGVATAAPSFGTTAAANPATTASALPSLPGFGTIAATAPTFGVSPAATTAPTFTLGTPASAATTTTKPTIPVLTGFSSAPPTTTTAITGFALTKTTTAAVAPTQGLGLPAVTNASASNTFANLSTATKTTDSAAVSSASQLTFNQLEEQINKWTLELEEQEKVFTEQATQINAWDKVLIGNNQKILELNDAVQKVKNDQQTLEQELEFIATQHNELEESIAPLEKEFSKMPQVDVERSQTYLMVENLDTQLKQMSEDLKEIIDNLNEANKGQDNTDPIIQIGKILNAHMSSLQWIESSTTNIQNKLDDIDKMHESFKRDSERSFRSAYYN